MRVHMTEQIKSKRAQSVPGPRHGRRPAAVLAALLAGLTGLLLVSCGAARPAVEPGFDEPPVVSGQTVGAPEGCSPEAVAERLQGLFAAVGNADPGLVDEYFDAGFQWYCLSSAQDPDPVTDLTQLSAYFQRRFEQHEQLRLRSVDFNGWESGRGLVHFGPIVVERRADDTGAGWQTATGKGAYSCVQRTFPVLCLGLNE